MEKNSLLEKAGIPINHLDFDYIKTCSNGNEVEKILQILRSGEEGYYPDLTKLAERRLQELKPESRLFRLEENILGRENLTINEFNSFRNWSLSMQSIDREISMQSVNENCYLRNVCPVRKSSAICGEKKVCCKSKSEARTKPIAVTDFKKWDKFNSEVEILNIDLDEERKKENLEVKNRVAVKKSNMIQLLEFDVKGHLNGIEKSKLCEEFRHRGNDYFRSKEYDNAIREYSKAIMISNYSEGAAFNNRALVYMKQKKFEQAIDDCNQCIKIEPDNIKAHLRRAQSQHMSGQIEAAHESFQRILGLDPKNKAATMALVKLKSDLKNSPPNTAKRIQIFENRAIGTNMEKSTVGIDYDFANLIIPENFV